MDIGRTVLVLQPWHAPVPLTRSWCLVRTPLRAGAWLRHPTALTAHLLQWEILSTIDGGVELHIALSPAQREAFQEALVRANQPLALHVTLPEG